MSKTQRRPPHSPSPLLPGRRQATFRSLIGLLAAFLVLTAVPSLQARTLSDQLGRRVEVPDAPRHIISLAPSITEIIFALGQENRLKGATQFSDYPDQARSLPKVGSYVRLDVEKIVALKPDLCIAVKDGNPIGVISKLDRLRIPVYAVDPRSMDSVITTVEEIGELLDAGERARKVTDNMRRRIDRVRSLVASTTSRPRVFFQIGIAPIVSVGSGTFIHELIVLAGGENLAAGETSYPRFSMEQVIGLAPDLMIITSMARGEVFESVKTKWQQWTSLPAVRDGRILLVDSDLFDRAAPRLVDGLERLVELIHPDLTSRDASTEVRP